jgi:murein DD-endopeptidase MepM/ murein hydrolase activator NlpD
MKQQYFIVVVAHSFHGRLRRLQIPHKAIYAILTLALLGAFSVAGMVGSYARMAWKVANYNSLQNQLETMRQKYRTLQSSADRTNEQLASLQMFAAEVSMAFGVKQQLEGPPDISGEGPLLPSYNETLEHYNFLKSATLSRGFHRYPRAWHANVRPSLWPINGRLVSSFGRRSDPFSGHGTFHGGVDLSASFGASVRAAADGVVAYAHWYGGYGRVVMIDHGGALQTLYAHLSRTDVIPGQEVRRGQIVGAAGSSGRATGAHLHYEVRQNGTPINPYIFLARSATSTTRTSDLPF